MKHYLISKDDKSPGLYVPAALYDRAKSFWTGDGAVHIDDELAPYDWYIIAKCQHLYDLDGGSPDRCMLCGTIK